MTEPKACFSCEDNTGMSMRFPRKTYRTEAGQITKRKTMAQLFCRHCEAAGPVCDTKELALQKWNAVWRDTRPKCCKDATASNGWHHDPKCKNWVETY